MANQQKWSETRVWGGGGGGHIGRRGGTLAPVQIRSAVDLNQEIWLELPDGSPYCLHVRNMNVQVLDGHPVSVVFVRPPGAAEEWVGLVYNLATGAMFTDAGLSLHLARTHAPATLKAVLLKVAAVLVALAIMWSGIYLLGFILLFAGVAIAAKIGQAFDDDNAGAIQRHLRRVNDWLVEEVMLAAKAGRATIVDGEVLSTPSTGG